MLYRDDIAPKSGRNARECICPKGARAMRSYALLET